MLNRGGNWKVITATVSDLEEQLNTLTRDGFEIFTIMPVGLPEPESHVPRERKSLDERTTFAVVACKPRA